MLESSLEDILRTKRKYHGPGNGGPAGPAYHGNSKGFGMTRKRICQLEVVEKKSIYGMWMDPLLFVKVTLFDPRDIIVLANILDVSASRFVGLVWVGLGSFVIHVPVPPHRKRPWPASKCNRTNRTSRTCCSLPPPSTCRPWDGCISAK